MIRSSSLIYLIATLSLIGCSTVKPITESSQPSVLLGTNQKVSKESEEKYSKGLTESAKFSSVTCSKTSESELKAIGWQEATQVANACFNSKSWAELEKVAEFLAQNFTESPWGLYYLSLVSENKKDYTKAIWLAEAATKRSPKVAMFDYQKGRLLWLMKDYTLAFQSFRSAVQKNPNLPEVHTFLAQIYTRDRDSKKASEHWAQASKLNPNDASLQYELSQALLNLGQTTQASEALNKAIELAPQKWSFHEKYIQVLEEYVKDPMKTKEAFTRLKSLQSRNKLDTPVPEAYFKRLTELQQAEELASRKAASVGKDSNEKTKK
jgi:tetratricopeptide (TPR) repeat protein